MRYRVLYFLEIFNGLLEREWVLVLFASEKQDSFFAPLPQREL